MSLVEAWESPVVDVGKVSWDTGLEQVEEEETAADYSLDMPAGILVLEEKVDTGCHKLRVVDLDCRNC